VLLAFQHGWRSVVVVDPTLVEKLLVVVDPTLVRSSG
jgi:hypothetical protein